MRCVAFEVPGSPEVLQIKQAPVPDLAEDEVLIHVAAAGVNRPDLLQRQGLYPAPESASPILGLEVAGTVVGVGSNAKPWRLGQRLCALTNGGGYADYVNVPASQCLPIPKHISFETAAALPEALFTVWANVYDTAKLGVGDSLLVHGGTGGIGSIAVQMARVTGARVYATVGSEEKRTICQKLGAVRAINYRTEDFATVVKQTTGRGADVILDVVGGSYIQRNIKAAAPGGRIVHIGFQGGANANVNFAPVMLKRLTLTGSTLRSRSKDEKAELAYQLQRKIWPAVCAERIVPIVHKTFSLEQVALAHKTLEHGSVCGKLVLVLKP